MNKKKTSLILFLTLSCVGIALLPILTYSLLTISIFDKGVDAITKGNLINCMQNFIYLKNTDNKDKSNIVENKIIITNDYQSLPKKLRSELPKNLKINYLYKIEFKAKGTGEDELYCIVSSIIDGEIYYAYQNIPINYAETFIKAQAIQTIYILSCTAIIILIILVCFIKILINKISDPIYSLSNWTNNLTSENINNAIPNFIYPELNCIAQLIHSNLLKEYDYIKHEEIFWRYCSHELRTPISAISVGVELLQKKFDNNSFNIIEYKNILLRLRRSVYSISYLIEAILWIGNNKKELIKSDIDISELILDVVSDMQKIYDQEDIKVNIIASEYIINVPNIAARIVLENVIRNAFQHSLGDEIGIIQNKNIIKVFNKIIPENGLSENIGFGLGLELIKRLATRLGWEIKILKDNEYNIVIISVY